MMGNHTYSHNGPIVAISVQAMNASLHHVTVMSYDRRPLARDANIAWMLGFRV
jgi:hypothetical protein